MSFINPNEQFNPFSVSNTTRNALMLNLNSSSEISESDILNIIHKNSSYGELCLPEDTDISLTVAGTFYKVPFGAPLINNNLTDNGDSTVSIIIPGVYQILSKIDGASSQNNVNIINKIYINGSPSSNNLTASRHYQQAGDDGSVSIIGLLTLQQGDIISLNMSSSVSSTTFTTHSINLVLNKISY